MITEIKTIRPKLRTWAATQPDPIRLRAGHIDKNLKELARDPNDTRPFKALVANHAALVAMVGDRAQSSEE